MTRKREVARQGGNRPRKPVVYIICEGEKTEITYFSSFRTRDMIISINPLPSKYQAAKELVEHAFGKVKQLDYSPETGDAIWCVFDRDDNSDEALRKAANLANKNGYRIAYSNPSFELWYLLHFVDQQGELTNEAAVEVILKKYLPGYDKAKDYCTLLKPHQAVALQRANQRIKMLQQNDVPLIRRVGNPYTTVSHLVEYLLARISDLHT